jgi:hypothetical protein
MQQRLWAEIMIVAGMVAALTMSAVAPARVAHPAPPPTAAAMVTTFIQSTVDPQVGAIEAAVATINGLAGPQQNVLQGTPALVTALTQQARALTAASHEFAALPPPTVGPLPTLHLQCLLEDLALFSAQVGDLLREAAAPVTITDYLAAAANLAYWPRMRSAAAILLRAEGWLQTIDHETGAHVRLPGFAGKNALEELLNLP